MTTIIFFITSLEGKMGESRVLFYIDSRPRKHIPWPVRVFCDTSATDWKLFKKRLCDPTEDYCRLQSTSLPGTDCVVTSGDIQAVVKQAKTPDRYAEIKSILTTVFNIVLYDPTHELLGLDPVSSGEGGAGIGRKRPIFSERRNEVSSSDDDEDNSGPAESSASRGDSSYDESSNNSGGSSSSNNDEEEENGEEESSDSEELQQAYELYKEKRKAMRKKIRKEKRALRRDMKTLRTVRQSKRSADDFDAETLLPAAKKPKHH
jgi:hypothetical protein